MQGILSDILPGPGVLQFILTQAAFIVLLIVIMKCLHSRCPWLPNCMIGQDAAQENTEVQVDPGTLGSTSLSDVPCPKATSQEMEEFFKDLHSPTDNRVVRKKLLHKLLVFMTKEVDHRGACLMLADMGISLEVPPVSTLLFWKPMADLRFTSGYNWLFSAPRCLLTSLISKSEFTFSTTHHVHFSGPTAMKSHSEAVYVGQCSSLSLPIPARTCSWFSSTFQKVDSPSQNTSEIIVTMHVFQKDLQEKYLEVLRLHITESGCQAERVSPKPYCNRIPRELFEQLQMLLEPNTVSGNDWRKLASRLGLCGTKIRFMSCQQSPAAATLEFFEELNGSLHDLYKIMLSMERLDCAVTVEAFLNDPLPDCPGLSQRDKDQENHCCCEGKTTSLASECDSGLTDLGSVKEREICSQTTDEHTAIQ